MPYLLLGPDDFSKKQFVDSLALKLKANLTVFWERDILPQASALTQTDLFSKGTVFWFNTMVPEFFGALPNMKESKNRVVVSVVSLDKRKKENKDLLANKNIETKEFSLPHGSELNDWIIERVKFYGGKIFADAAESLAVKLGRDDAREIKIGGKVIAIEEIYSLWQADSEIQKLIAYAKDREVSGSDVNQLVTENREVDVFSLTNAIADNKKQEALSLLHDFLKEQTGADEKGAVIQLNALLSEQFRNVAMIQDFVSHKTSESDILEKTGWKSGRLFVIKKIASRFPAKKVLETLNKLEALDLELKTSQTPPRVLLDLIVSQLLT
jgi:DNA polymerase III delta subunit